ncbi:MAG: rhodanese-related sulfurtransferase [Parasphingorhabdus sp.]|jgi:rhodanese-related sulfurtransferase
MIFNQNSLFRCLGIISCLVLGACDATVSEPTQPEIVTTAAEEVDPDSKGFISAEFLSSLIKDNAAPPILDVRAIASFEESHIVSASSLPYGEYTDEDVSKLAGNNKSGLIVTYCGCPRHLSGLVAEQLREKGFSDVRVLYEGYWYWKDNGYPVVEQSKSARSTLKFEGQLVSDIGPVAGHNIFIRNLRNDQLEATQTDEQGKFQTGFEILGYLESDQFAVTIDSPKATVRKLISGSPDEAHNLVVSTD